MKLDVIEIQFVVFAFGLVGVISLVLFLAFRFFIGSISRAFYYTCWGWSPDDFRSELKKAMSSSFGLKPREETSSRLVYKTRLTTIVVHVGSECAVVVGPRFIFGSIGLPENPSLEYVKERLEYIERLMALDNLGTIRGHTVMQQLLSALSIKDYAVRREASKALSEVGDERAVKPLMAALREDPHYDKPCKPGDDLRDALEAIVLRVAKRIPVGDLIALAHIEGTTYQFVVWYGRAYQSEWDTKTREVDMSRVREFAQMELVRRRKLRFYNSIAS